MSDFSSYSMEAGITRHHSNRWCGAQSSVTLDHGVKVKLICTRFRGHLIHPQAKKPLQHFDEVKKRSWYDADTSLPAGPCEPSAE